MQIFVGYWVFPFQPKKEYSNVIWDYITLQGELCPFAHIHAVWRRLMPKMFSGGKKKTIFFQYVFIFRSVTSVMESKNQAHGVVQTNIWVGDYTRDCVILRDSGKTARWRLSSLSLEVWTLIFKNISLSLGKNNPLALHWMIYLFTGLELLGRFCP